MKSLHIGKGSHHFHMPDRHASALWLKHVVEDERFWPVVVAFAILGVLIFLAVWAGITGEANPDFSPINPFPPYNF